MTTKRKHGQNSDSSDEETNRGYESDEEGGVRIDDIYIPPPPRPPGTIEVNGQRIIITKIVNTNFKSYGEVQMLGPFHKVRIYLLWQLVFVNKFSLIEFQCNCGTKWKWKK